MMMFPPVDFRVGHNGIPHTVLCSCFQQDLRVVFERSHWSKGLSRDNEFWHTMQETQCYLRKVKQENN